LLLKTCAHNTTRRYASADDLRHDLARIEPDKPTLRPSRILLPVAIVMALIAAWGLVMRHAPARKQAQAASAPATATVTTEPAGAMVILGDRVERSPANFRGLNPGKYPLRVMLPDFDSIETEVAIGSADNFRPPVFKLSRSKGSAQLASVPAGAHFELRRAGEPARHGRTPVLLRDWPTGVYDAVARQGDWELRDRIEIKRGEVALKTFQFANGSVKIISAPVGATVSLGEKELGQTPLLLDEVKPGEVSYQLQLAGFNGAAVHGSVRPNEQTFLATRLEKKLSPVRGAVWQNSIGMRFAPVGDWHISAWETRVRDMAAFCGGTTRRAKA